MPAKIVSDAYYTQLASNDAPSLVDGHEGNVACSLALTARSAHRARKDTRLVRPPRRRLHRRKLLLEPRIELLHPALIALPNTDPLSTGGKERHAHTERGLTIKLHIMSAFPAYTSSRTPSSTRSGRSAALLCAPSPCSANAWFTAMLQLSKRRAGSTPSARFTAGAFIHVSIQPICG